MSVSAKIIRKIVSDDGRDVQYDFGNGRVRRFHSEEHALDQMSNEIRLSLSPELAEAWAIILDQNRGDMEGKTVTIDPAQSDPIEVK